jgi:hypothetical protein
MIRRFKWSLVMSAAALAVVAACSVHREDRSEEIGSHREAVVTTQVYSLPVPVGLNPESLTLGARSISLNDRSRLIDGNHEGDVAAVGSLPDTNIGSHARVRNVWSRPSTLVRGSLVSGYIKTNGSLTVQPGGSFGDPEENREAVPIRQDPIWTVPISVSDSGAPVTTSAIGPGTYGIVSLAPGQQLTLTSPGVYNFVQLRLEPGSVLTLPQAGPTQINVHSGMILRSPLSGAGLIVAYLGLSSVHVESPFSGDLFLAPNAVVEIKQHSTGTFFASRIEVHQDIVVTRRPLSQAARDLFMPSETGQAPGAVSPTGVQDEIASAILMPNMNSSCPADRAFVTYHGATLLHQDVSAFGSATAPTLPALPVPVAPAACIGSPMPGWDHDPSTTSIDAIAYPIVPGGTPSYTHAVGTDSVITRLSAGRVVQVGFQSRYCDDPAPPQAANCPATIPNTICDPSTDTGTCSYQPDISCTCSAAPPPALSLWRCGSRHRAEAGGFGVRMSTDCGSTWTAGVVDPFARGMPGPARGTDRHEIHYDPFDRKLYLSFSAFRGSGVFDGAVQTILKASTEGITDASQLTFQEVRPPDPRDAGPVVMATVVDERARLNTSPVTHGTRVHLASFRCAGSVPTIEFETTYGRSDSWNIAQGDPDPSALCTMVPKGTNGMPFDGIHYGPSIVGVSSAPPRFRVAYSGTSASGYEILNVYSVTLRSAQGYDVRPDIVRELVVDASATGGHVIFPQLIAPDHFGGSDLFVDTPVVLRYTTVTGDAVREDVRVLYSGLSSLPRTLGSWSVSATFPGATPCTTRRGCFAGDYRYGAFYKKSAGVLTFFTPWAGGRADGSALPAAHAGIYLVAP